MIELPADVRALFDGSNQAHVATLLPDGGPHSVPVFVGLEGDRIAFFTSPGSRKARNREYRYRTTRVPRPNSEWIAVPVPDAGVPRDVVERAREAIKDNRPPSSAEHRHWQLSGRILYCGECGRSMTPRTSRGGSNRPKLYCCYYACLPKDRAACSNRKKLRAQETEDLVWEVVRNLLTRPEQLRSDLEEIIEHQRRGIRGDPNREAKA